MSPAILGIISVILVALDRLFSGDSLPAKLHLSHAWRVAIKLCIGAVVTSIDAALYGGVTLSAALIASLTTIGPSIVTQVIEAVAGVPIVEDAPTGDLAAAIESAKNEPHVYLGSFSDK